MRFPKPRSLTLCLTSYSLMTIVDKCLVTADAINRWKYLLFCQFVVSASRTAEADEKARVQQHRIQSVDPRIRRTHSAASPTSFHTSSPFAMSFAKATGSKCGE